MHICRVNNDKHNNPNYLLKMKKITFILFALITGTTFAQNGTANETATATADVVSVISIVKDFDLNFGKVITGTAGTVIIGQDGTRSTSSTADYVTSTATKAAKFTITAEQGYTYSIGLVNTTLTGAGDPMSFTLDPSLSAAGNAGNVDKELFIGGTLTVASTQAVGAYAGEVVVTVAYE